MPRGRPAIYALLLACAAMLALSPAGADEARVIQLKHRPANVLIPTEGILSLAREADGRVAGRVR